MPTEQDVLRLVLAYQEVWFQYFPQQSRRADWHILHHLCTKGREGTLVGELYGLAKQVFLLDDSTVKERILSLAQAGLCTLDPAGQVLSRTLATPTARLLAQYDAHLKAFHAKLAALAGLAPAASPEAITPTWRAYVLRPLETYQDRWSAAVDTIFDTGKLSAARRGDAKRHLIASSYWNLQHIVALWHAEHGDDPSGVQADRLAARLLELTGQTLQTTRDHIVYLIETGIFQRLKGRTMHVCLTEPAQRAFSSAARQTAAELPALLGTLFADVFDDPAERTLNRKSVQQAPRLFLEIAATGERRLIAGSVTIGRAAPSDWLLKSVDVSRRHCRAEPRGGHLLVTDLGSTNGTFVNGRQIDTTTVLSAGDRLSLGSYVLVCGEGGDDSLPRQAERSPA